MTLSPEILAEALGRFSHAHTRAAMLAMHCEEEHGAESGAARSSAALQSELEDALRLCAKAGLKPSAVKTSPSSFDLGALAEMDAGKPDALALAARLRALLPLALDLDVKRGRVVSAKVPLQPGETPSTDVAEMLSDLCARLEQEAGVGVGKGLE